MYNMELSKPVKIVYDLNNECLNPQTIEKTKVSLAARIFGEPTRSTFTYYCEKWTAGMGEDIELFKIYRYVVVSSKCQKHI